MSESLVGRWLDGEVHVDPLSPAPPPGDPTEEEYMAALVATGPPDEYGDVRELRPGDRDRSRPAGSRLGKVLARSQLAELPSITPLIDGVMSTPAAVVMVGGYGLGKSILTHAFACCVATGTPWLGHEVKQARVLLVIGEGAHGQDARITAWEYAYNAGERVPDDALTVLVKPGSLADPATWQELQAYAVAGRYGLVLLDTLSSLAPDADETKDAARIMRHLSDLSEAVDGTAVLVHHPGWADGTRTRGGYQLEGNADEVLVLTGVAEGSDLVNLTMKKVKDGPGGRQLWLARHACFGSVVMEHARPNDADAPLRARLLAALAGYGEVGATGPQLVAEMGVPDAGRSGFYKALRKLVDANEVTSAGAGNRQRYFLAVRADR